jgi:mitochondrial chaperone BCS1
VQQQITPLETINVSFLTRDRGIVGRLMRDARPEDEKNSIQVTLYNAQGHAGSLRRRKRGLDTVFADRAVKERLVERFQWFLGAEEWHTKRGIPWKLGILLHGAPGTGKTSLIHAIASDFGFNIKYVKSLHGLGQAFLYGGKNDLFVIEDIDAMSAALNRGSEQKAPEDGSGRPAGSLAIEPSFLNSPLHEVLNAMDGMQTPDGLKFIVTTNHIGRLDPAIVRPGRIDDVIEVGPLSIESGRAMFKAFYGRDGITGYTPRTGAYLQQLFSTHTAEAAEAELARVPPPVVAVVPERRVPANAN